MKSYSIFLIAFSLSVQFCFSQNHENISDSSGLKHGYAQEFSETDGKKILVSEGNYLHGSKNGPWKSYYPNGKLKSSIV